MPDHIGLNLAILIFTILLFHILVLTSNVILPDHSCLHYVKTIYFKAFCKN